MRVALLAATLTLSAFAMAETNVDEEKDANSEPPVAHVTNQDRQVVVITEAEFVPFSQYLGVPDVNNLPPTSAGKPAQQRMP